MTFYVFLSCCTRFLQQWSAMLYLVVFSRMFVTYTFVICSIKLLTYLLTYLTVVACLLRARVRRRLPARPRVAVIIATVIHGHPQLPKQSPATNRAVIHLSSSVTYGLDFRRQYCSLEPSPTRSPVLRGRNRGLSSLYLQDAVYV